jgi:hypothetical protein
MTETIQHGDGRADLKEEVVSGLESPRRHNENLLS